MEVYVNNKKLHKINIVPTTTISQLKETIKGIVPQNNYTIRLIFNNGEELSPIVFQTNTYDNNNFQSHKEKIQGGQIYVNTKTTMDVNINNQKMYQINILPTTTISQLKETIKGIVKQNNYTIRLVFNNGEELLPLVFQTNTYDNTNFQSQATIINGGQIYINNNITTVMIEGLLSDDHSLLLKSQISRSIFCDSMDWLTIREKIQTCNILSNDLKNKINNILKNTSKDIVYYISNPGDAVKNSFTPINNDNKLTIEFKRMDYDDKADYLYNAGLRSRDDNNYRQWPLQQWGKNVMKYSKLTDKHLIYVQADYWYCAYPSTFAEALCYNLFSGYKHYPGSGFHFFGDNIDLFCVGNSSIEYKITNIIKTFPNIRYQKFMADEHEWWRMTDEFLLDLYSTQPFNQDVKLLIPEQMSYPIEYWTSEKKEPKSYSGSIKIGMSISNPFNNVRFVKDLNLLSEKYGFSRYVINRRSISSKALNYPLVYMIDTDPSISISVYGILSMSSNPTAKYNLQKDLIFSGTVDNPQIRLR